MYISICFNRILRIGNDINNCKQKKEMNKKKKDFN